MGREKPNKPRRKRPSEIVAALVANYRCGSCNSDPATMREISPGCFVMDIGHDDHCPVLNGAVDPIHDTLRALDRAS